MADALSANNLTFGILRPNNANGVPKHLFTKKSVADVFVPQVDLIYQMEFVLSAWLQNTGIIKIKHVKDALIHLFMTSKNNNVYVLQTNHTFLKEDAYLVICHTIGTQTLVNAFRVLLLSSIIIKQEGVFVLQKDLIW